MVLKGTATLIVRLSRALAARPLKNIFTHNVNQKPPLNKIHQIYSKHPPKFYLFPSIYRSFFITNNGQNMKNLMPFRTVLNEIKRRLFFAGLYIFNELNIKIFDEELKDFFTSLLIIII